MSPKVTTRTRAFDAGLGVLYAALALLLVVVALMVYNKTFSTSTDVVLRTGSLGNALQKGSDVQLNGVPVGRIKSIVAEGEGAKLELALDPEVAAELPKDTVARLLPKTLFGERYVMLVPEGSAAKGLHNGDVIKQDTSDEAVELEDVFDQLLPTLRAIQPAKLAASLGELSIALSGEGQELGDSMAKWSAYLKQLNPLVPQMSEDFARLGTVTKQYDAAAPDLVNALATMTTTSKTMVAENTELTDLFASVISSSDTTTGWVRNNKDTIVVLSDQSRKALAAVRPYASQFPCTFKAMAGFIPVMDKALGKGTKEPGIHVRLNVVAARGRYLPGKDKVRYDSGGKAHCPYATGAARVAPGSPEAIPAPPSRALAEQLGQQVGAIDGLGQANSPGENQFIAELVGPTLGLAPSEYPKWGSLLVGPTLRNAKVTLQ